MFTWSENISNAMYEWVLDPTSETFGMYDKVFANFPNGGYGIEKCFFFMLAVGILSSAIYYFVVAASSINATKKNYIIMCVMGYIFLVFTNYIGLSFFTEGGSEVWTSLNMLKIAAVDILYYLIVFELASLLMKSFSKAPNIHLFTVFK